MNNIEVKNLSKFFSYYKKEEGLKGSIKALFKRKKIIKKAVNNISFNIKQGEFVGFVGPNGAGKTTTLKLLTGIIHPTRGSMNILGFNPTKRKEEYKKNISIVFGERGELWETLPAIESFNLIREIYEIPKDIYKKRLNEFAKLMDIKNLLHIQVRNLSMGQRMKCELLTSFLHDPKIIFLDEPTIGLDVVSQKNIRDFLLKYNRLYKTTIILTSHNMEDVEDLCKRIIIINKGKIGYDGSLKKLVSIYNKRKKIELTFNKPVSQNYLSDFGKVKMYNKYNSIITIPKNNSKETISKIIKFLPIKDISISSVDLEEIIYRIFSNYKK